MIKNSVEIESCSFVLEPSYKKDGSIHSWEILTKSVKKKNANSFHANGGVFCFSSLNDKEIIDVFNKQILIIEGIDALKLNFKPVSLNVDSIISDYILNDKYVSDYLKNQKNIAFEISEDFHEFNTKCSMADLKCLSKLCPVWLDDFGRGLTSLTIIEMFNFECIKIDKDYFWEIQNDSGFFKKINKVKSYCNFLIVEGVETIEQRNKVHSVVNSACQGRLWMENYYYIKS
ncbi:EAL domain-containing protein [Klebsiella variicola]|uniref:EAL domain-containing protein n=1 Tax=Klebsiella variicola TaxID=244366 RepID=UPI001432A7BB|nr:EAL domain-containing protein [Klebsiella variicola]MCH6141808.1 EAL domain-containing protein [Klebsiella variicola]MCH6176657.1 EAL domain-containing protein [Klebsiella variicola]NKD43512.1 EAL domain-containing protein [Escherichia coli]